MFRRNWQQGHALSESIALDGVINQWAWKKVYVPLCYYCNIFCWGWIDFCSSLCAVQQLLHFPWHGPWLCHLRSNSSSWRHVPGSRYACPYFFISHKEVQLPLTFLCYMAWDLPPIAKFTSASCLWRTLGLCGAAESLASEIRPEHLARRQLFPAFSEIRSISAHIGAAVAAKAYELGMAPLTLSWDFYVALACPGVQNLCFAQNGIYPKCK